MTWPTLPLEEACELITDGTHHSPPNAAAGPIKYVTAKNIRPWGLDLDDITYVSEEVHREIYARCPVRRGDVLYIKDGVTTGLAVVNPLDEPFSMLSSVALLRPKAGLLHPEFLRHWLNSPATLAQMTSNMTGTAIKRLVLRQLRAARVPIPSLEEQHAVVRKLEAERARVARAREALDAVPPLLEKLRQSILAAAFRGDLTKDWRAKHPNVEPASELLERLRAERRKKWEDSELAKATRKGAGFNWESWKAKYKEPAKPEPTGLQPLPAGWRWTTFETVGEVDLGRQRAPQYQTGRFPRPYLRVANVKDDRLDLDDVLEMDFDEDDFRRYQLRPGDILISEGQSPELVGQSAIYRGGIDGLCFQKTLHRFRPAAGFVSPEYAQLVCRLYLRDGTFRAASSLTVNIAHLTLVRLKPLRFPLAPFDEQGEIVRRAHAALGRVRSLEDGAEALTELRGSLDRALLAKAFRGELVPHPPNIEPRTTTPCEEADRNKRVAPDGSQDVVEAG